MCNRSSSSYADYSTSPQTQSPLTPNRLLDRLGLLSTQSCRSSNTDNSLLFSYLILVSLLVLRGYYLFSIDEVLHLLSLKLQLFQRRGGIGGGSSALIRASRWTSKPVPAGMSRPIVTFSLRPRR